MRIVGRLLISRFGDDTIDVAAIKPAHVRRFFAEQAKLYSKPATAGTVVATLRGYFRYRASLGNVVHGLIGALAYPANWQLSSLPKALTAEEVEQLIGSLGQPGRSMRRADAIVRCALDLGCAVAKWPESASTISTGAPAQSPCDTPRAVARMCCLCR